MPVHFKENKTPFKLSSQKFNPDNKPISSFHLPIAHNFNDLEWSQNEIDFSNSHWFHHSVNFCSGGCGYANAPPGDGEGDPPDLDGGGGKSCADGLGCSDAGSSNDDNDDTKPA